MNDNAPPNDVPARVRALIVRTLDVAVTLADGERLADLGADSLNKVELCAAAEEEFAITLPGTADELMDTVGDFIALVTRHLPSPPAATGGPTQEIPIV